MPRKTVLKKKQKEKIALLVLAIVGVLLILSWATKLIQNFFSSPQEANLTRNYRWNGKFDINLLIRTDKVSLFSYSPKEGKIEIINLPDNTYLEVPYGFGYWKLSSIYDLGQSQKDIGGDKLLVETLTRFFALPIDGLLDFSTLKKQKPVLEIVDDVRRNPFSGLGLLSSLKTNLTAWELLKLKLSIASVRFDKVKALDLDQLNVLTKEKLLDGTEVLTLDPIKLDSILTELADAALVSEYKSVAVFNATDHPQLASKWARLITNLGGNVISTSNAKTKLLKSQVLGVNSQTYQRMKEIFDLDCQNNPKCDKISWQNEDIETSRAEINIFLGEDYVK